MNTGRSVVLIASLLVFVAIVTLPQTTLAEEAFAVYYGPMMHASGDSPDVVRTIVPTDGIVPLELSRGPGLNPRNLTNGYSADNWDREFPSLEDSIMADLYFQFGFKVEEGFTANLSSLDLALRRSTKPAPEDFAVLVSLDGFETRGTIVQMFSYYGRASGEKPAEDYADIDPYFYMYSDAPGRGDSSSFGDPIPTIDLSDVELLQNIEGGTTVTFRLYAWGKAETTDRSTVALGRVVGPEIKGTVATTQ